MTELETELLQALRNLHSEVVSLVECIEECEEDGGESYTTQNTRERLGAAWHVMTKCGPIPEPDPRPVLTPGAGQIQMSDTIEGIDILYLVDGDRIVMSMNGQVHAPISLQDIANLLNKYHAMRNVAAEALDETDPIAELSAPRFRCSKCNYTDSHGHCCPKCGGAWASFIVSTPTGDDERIKQQFLNADQPLPKRKTRVNADPLINDPDNLDNFDIFYMDDDRQPTEEQEWTDGMRDAGMGTDEDYGDFGGEQL